MIQTHRGAPAPTPTPRHPLPPSTIPATTDITDLSWLATLAGDRLAELVDQLDDAIRLAGQANLPEIEVADVVAVAATGRILLRRQRARDAIRQARLALDEARRAER